MWLFDLTMMLLKCLSISSISTSPSTLVNLVFSAATSRTCKKTNAHVVMWLHKIMRLYQMEGSLTYFLQAFCDCVRIAVRIALIKYLIYKFCFNERTNGYYASFFNLSSLALIKLTSFFNIFIFHIFIVFNVSHCYGNIYNYGVVKQINLYLIGCWIDRSRRCLQRSLGCTEAYILRKIA